MARNATTIHPISIGNILMWGRADRSTDLRYLLEALSGQVFPSEKKDIVKGFGIRSILPERGIQITCTREGNKQISSRNLADKGLPK